MDPLAIGNQCMADASKGAPLPCPAYSRPAASPMRPPARRLAVGILSTSGCNRLLSASLPPCAS